MVSADGSAAICMRVANYHPKTFRDGVIGFVHRLTEQPLPYKPYRPEKPKKREPEIDAEAMMNGYLEATPASHISELAEDLGVKASALIELKVAWAAQHQAFAWPMRDGTGKIVGIRLRNSKGEKWSVRGSHNGLFLPYCHSESTAYIVEGGTDCAAVLSLGLYAIGRPSCSGGLYELKALFDRLEIRRAVIIADNDKPGLEGAEQLVRHSEIPCCVITLPCKDVREFVNMEGTAEMLCELEKSFVWRNVI